MCGISGIVNIDGKTPSKEILGRMTDSMTHRGPDDSGLFIHENTGLGHRRLSIIDLGGGSQPLSNESSEIWTVFNGEIYNYRELRDQLKAEGHIFKTASDTEVIVHLYEKYGKDFATRLEGMFAIAVYDRRKEKLILTRDRLGKKPICYFYTKNIFAFSSEISSLKKHPDFPEELNFQALHEYFSLQYISAPDTAYKKVFKLMPASTMELDTISGEYKIETYWQPDFHKKTSMNFQESSTHLRTLMEKAVEKRLESDVPLGVFLSGGIDSAIVCGLMAKKCLTDVKSFSIAFENPLYDESELIKRSASHIEHISGRTLSKHMQTVNPADFDALIRLISNLGEPFADASLLPTFMLSRFTREHVTVAMSGDGADELFAGYDRYRAMKALRPFDLVPHPLRKALSQAFSAILFHEPDERTRTGRLKRIVKSMGAEYRHRYHDMTVRFSDQQKNELYAEKFIPHKPFKSSREQLSGILSRCSSRDSTEILQELDLLCYLPGDILVKADTASMAASLETRSPFLDREIVEFAAALPEKWKLNRKQGKYILRETFKDLIAPEILCSKKRGFGVPLSFWFRNQWKELLKSCLLDGLAVGEKFLNKKRLEEMIYLHQSGKRDYSYQLWALLVFEIFLENRNS